MKSQNEDSISVWEIQFNRTLTESEEWLILGHGAEGIEKRGSNYFALFAGTGSAARKFCELIESSELKVISTKAIPDKNWVQCCSELWSPVSAGRITVLPVLNADQPAPLSTTELSVRLIPGTGFGTGHHESTRMVLGLLQHRVIVETPPKSILDVGTGSGILSITAAALYRCKIDAVDTDPLAVENAATNVTLNGMNETISVRQGSIEENKQRYDLVLANIYAEVLIELAPFLRAATVRGGHLILSGITLDKRDLLLTHFLNWEVVEERQDNNWVALLMELK